MGLSCSDLLQAPGSGTLGILSDENLSGTSALLLPPSSSFSPQLSGLSALVRPGGGWLGGVEGLNFRRESVGVSTRDAGFQRVVGGAGG